MDRIRYCCGMDATTGGEAQEHGYEAESKAGPAVPEAAIAGDWTILAAVAAAIAGVLLWRRRDRRSGAGSRMGTIR